MSEIVIGSPWLPKPIGTTIPGKPTESYPAKIDGCGRDDLTNVGSGIENTGFEIGDAKLVW